jgi:probable F420-dependent oxidoreductase
MRPVKFNVGLPNGDFANISAFAKRAEELGYYSISIDDHFFMRNMFGTPELPHLECYTVLAALATATRTIRLAPLVTAMSYRTPQLLAKIIATLDNISGGRLIAGLGAGWLKEEYDAYNYPYPSNAERMEQLADGIKVLKAMWTQEAATYSGRFFKVQKAFCNPKPVQKPYPPIMIGGGGKRILQIAAQEADILNLNPPVTEGVVNLTEAFKFDKPEVKRRIAMVKEFVKAAGRQPDALEISGGRLRHRGEGQSDRRCDDPGDRAGGRNRRRGGGAKLAAGTGRHFRRPQARARMAGGELRDDLLLPEFPIARRDGDVRQGSNAVVRALRLLLREHRVGLRKAEA